MVELVVWAQSFWLQRQQTQPQGFPTSFPKYPEMSTDAKIVAHFSHFDLAFLLSLFS